MPLLAGLRSKSTGRKYVVYFSNRHGSEEERY